MRLRQIAALATDDLRSRKCRGAPFIPWRSKFKERTEMVLLALISFALFARASGSDTHALHPRNFERALSANFNLQPFPGQTGFVFTIYGAPAELGPMKELVEVMKSQQLGNGFDPGPTPTPGSRPVFDYLATIGWPVMCYPGCADMQIKGGRCVLGAENLAALESMDKAGAFTAVQLGEWGYYFHNLSCNEGWWHDVYGSDFTKFKHLMKPAGLAGYDRRPESRRECHDIVKDYFLSRQHDLLGRVISVTGHSHYEAYAGEWGARCVGLEVGENIAFTQSKLAFARGASRQWRVPWSVQVSPWFAGSVTTSGPLRTEGGVARGLDAGHSLSFYERMWLHGWFSGASMVTPENSIAIFFENASAPWTLTEHGRKASEVFRFVQSHDRGVPYTPVAVVLDRYAGYNGYMDKPWGILDPTPGDRETRDLFDYQLFPGSDHIHHRPDPKNPESSYLRPTPYGELFDVQLSSASAAMLGSYAVILLAGDIEFESDFVSRLEMATGRGTILLMSKAHERALQSMRPKLLKNKHVEILEPWMNPATGRAAAISNDRLAELAREMAPVEVTGDPVEYAINRTRRGWVVELINNSGVSKKPAQAAVVDPSAIAHVKLSPRFRWSHASEWRGLREYRGEGPIQLELSPGASAFVEVVAR